MSYDLGAGAPRPEIAQSAALKQARSQMEHAPGSEEMRLPGTREQRRTIKENMPTRFELWWARYRWWVIGAGTVAAVGGAATIWYLKDRP